MKPGTLLDDRFEIGDPAGSGGMGTVYRARDRSTGSPVAVKVLRAGAAPDRRRFEREARVLAELRHPGIVRYVAHGHTPDGEPWFAMEWLAGEDLSGRLDRGALSVSESIAVVRQAAEAIGAAHRAGVVHRDVKPPNLFLVGGEVGAVKVLDFGVARIDESFGGTFGGTATGAVIGSPGYIAPEQARGTRDIDARADVFSLGCVLFACLTGRAPYEGEGALVTFAKVLLDPPPRVRSVWPEVPPALDELVARMMSVSTDERPGDAVVAAQELDALSGLPDVRIAPGPRPVMWGASEQRLLCVALIPPPSRARPEVITPPPRGTLVSVSVSGEVMEVTASEGNQVDEIAQLAWRYGGRLEPLANGARLLAFAGRGVATDQALRAARCARVIAERLGVIIALTTGRSATSSGGEVVGRAADLLGAATRHVDGPVAVAIDPATAGLLGGRFEVQRVAQSGTESSLWLLGAELDPFDTERPLLGKVTPCVGRDRELATLEATFEECVEESVARVVLLTGPAGAGKSRIRQELVRRLRDKGRGNFELWLARGDAVSAGSPLGLVAEVLRSTSKISGAEPIEERREKLLARAGWRLPKVDAVRVAHFLGEVAGVPFPAELDIQLDAARQDASL